MMSRSGIFSVAVLTAVLGRPDLWATAVRAIMTLAPAGWWKKRPYLPVPDPGWLRFRSATAYGGADEVPCVRPQDVVVWLEWQRGFNNLSRR